MKTKQHLLIFMVNGSEVKIKGHPNDKLIDLVRTAIKMSSYDNHRDVSEFQIIMKRGSDDGSTTLKNYNKEVLKSIIFVTLKAGVGA